MEKFTTTDTIGIIFSILSLSFAVWQYLQNRRIKKLIALEAVELHINIAKALGATQAAKTEIANGKSPSFEVGRAEGLCQAVLYESAKLYCNLKGTKIDDIDDLIKNGQLEKGYKDIYYSFSDTKRGYFGKILKGFINFF